MRILTFTIFVIASLHACNLITAPEEPAEFWRIALFGVAIVASCVVVNGLTEWIVGRYWK